MKIAVVSHGDETIVVADCGAYWINVTRADLAYSGGDAPLSSVSDLVESGLLTAAYIEGLKVFTLAKDEFKVSAPEAFLQPLYPGKIVAVGRNYKAHVEEFDNKMPTEPTLFCKRPDACVGPDEAIEVQDWYGRVDHEGELAVVIGKRAKDIDAAKVQDYIAGYTLLNDVTARELQKADIAQGNPWFRAKNLDTFCPIGPVVVLAEDLGWPLEVDIAVEVNGETRQSSNTRKFIFSLGEQLAAITRFMTLEPGDVVATGTPEGVSPLHDGDVVSVMCPEIGVLSNPVKQA